jgi:hypothetical protein
LVAGLALAGCSSTLVTSDQSNLNSETVNINASSVFPYNPLVYHLDLAILAYQLHGQSLVWPHDPYYEELSNKTKGRAGMIAKVKAWAGQTGNAQIIAPKLDSYRGPGSLNGFANNSSHDPIVYNYSLLDPWNNSIMNAAGIWTEYMTPRTITSKIKETHVCYRPTGAGNSASTSIQIIPGHNNVSKSANAYLLAFEGGTGDKGEAGQPPSQSIMGFIMTRDNPDGTYDVHISFRGSRSGSAGRAVLQSFSGKNAKGNPDWITDLGYDRLSSGAGGAFVSTVGKVHRGFVTSLKSIMPNLMNCLQKVPSFKDKVAPNNIYVTGHSLGGALAQQFVSSILLGNKYGPDGTGVSIPGSLGNWPWQNIKLVTFGAPRVGDAEFAKKLTVDKLQSEFFSTAISPTDPKAIKVSEVSILSRLANSNRPAAYRVLNSKDPITSQKGAGGKHVGKTVYVNPQKLGGSIGAPDFSAHEQRQIRDYMLSGLPGNRAPNLAIRYVDMLQLNPTRDAKQNGTPAEIQKLVDTVKNYYRTNKIWFNLEAFEKNVALRKQIRGNE